MSDAAANPKALQVPDRLVEYSWQAAAESRRRERGRCRSPWSPPHQHLKRGVPFRRPRPTT